MKSRFEGIFKTSNPACDKYLARLFGLFSEEVVLNWCAYPTSPYENLGRPTLWVSGKRGSTLDFTLRRRATGNRCRPAPCPVASRSSPFSLLRTAFRSETHRHSRRAESSSRHNTVHVPVDSRRRPSGRQVSSISCWLARRTTRVFAALIHRPT